MSVEVNQRRLYTRNKSYLVSSIYLNCGTNNVMDYFSANVVELTFVFTCMLFDILIFTFHYNWIELRYAESTSSGIFFCHPTLLQISINVKSIIDLFELPHVQFH